MLEIRHGDTMLMEADYGSRRVLLSAPEPELLENGERFTATGKNRVMIVEIRYEHCTDVMSGAAYSSRVSVELDGRQYQGCGEALEPL